MKRRLVVFVLDNYVLFSDELSQSMATMKSVLWHKTPDSTEYREKFQEHMRKRRDTAMGDGDGRVIRNTKIRR